MSAVSDGEQGRLFARTPSRGRKPSMFPCEDCGHGFDVVLAVDSGDPTSAAYLCPECRFLRSFYPYDPEKAVIPL